MLIKIPIGVLWDIPLGEMVESAFLQDGELIMIMECINKMSAKYENTVTQYNIEVEKLLYRIYKYMFYMYA